MQAATLDIIVNIPRSAFSTQQIQMMFWFLKSNGESRIQSAKTLRNQNTVLHSMCGIRTLEYDSAFGHKFFINSLADLICQEMANPHVRNYLRFYPEDAGKTVSEYWHARHWHEVADPSLVTPMAVINNTQFFVYEPAILTNSSWIIEEYKTVIVSGGELLVSFRSWVGDQVSCILPSTTSLKAPSWNQMVGNRWCVLAGKACVYTFPIWLYCDNVSRNQFKRWNKHYSFLFSAAGLPCALFQHEYNVHFLCTSNLATTLEMMDGIVSQLEVAWKTGIWAWDCVHSDHVLVIPFEFACHVGPGGRFLCHICDVKGVDGSINEFHSPIMPTSTDGADGGCTTPNSVGTSDGDGNSSANACAPATGWKRKLESMQDMVARVTQFMSTGIKDTFLETFLKWMHLSHKNKSGRYDKQVALDRFKATLPESTSMLSQCGEFNVLTTNMPGLDPHTDTPVEILHTILLGFVKYFWRNVVHNQLGTNPPKKELLKTCLNSLDFSGLQIGQHLSGCTLVALYVLYDLVADPCFNAWVSLSNLVALLWQPAIEDIDEYIAHLDATITEFLYCVICWTPCWFNNLKFHFILHLLAHIQHFGPAVLFATEMFESYNAIIWGKSVHLNHLAPSRDIAIAFSHYS
ncbi:hypothetical protein EI94DRAFT_1770789 [Lactarius quietus]|nr:hypothetical protein EI94DRAFT_1770789 [Lactarius quietus]